jgi:hypothetical protein
LLLRPELFCKNGGQMMEYYWVACTITYRFLRWGMVEWMGNGLSFYCNFENVWWGFKNNLKQFVF